MNIKSCSQSDVPAILDLYQTARNLQKERKAVVWPFFTESFLLQEIMEMRQFKIVVEGEMACNWVITYSDKEIWGDKDLGDSIFIHRICTSAKFKGNRFIDTIVDWAKDQAIKQGRKHIRLDTLGQNDKLIKHYTSAGFNFLGIHRLTETVTLPKHYQDEPDCCLFEIEL